MQNSKSSSFILGAFLFFGLCALGYLLGDAAIKYKHFERSVKVKGLSEREFNADVVIWPIQFTVVSNELEVLYKSVDENTSKIQSYLGEHGVAESEISFASPAITDKIAQQYSNESRPPFRYSALQTITVYSKNVDTIRSAMSGLSKLGKQGIIFSTDNYNSQIEYIFTRLNEVKPSMIEEATTKAREVADKFASDSNSALGKIKKASQGQFSIGVRDKNNPHIKKVRVVSTVEYYLSD